MSDLTASFSRWDAASSELCPKPGALVSELTEGSFSPPGPTRLGLFHCIPLEPGTEELPHVAGEDTEALTPGDSPEATQQEGRRTSTQVSLGLKQTRLWALRLTGASEHAVAQVTPQTLI